MNYRKAHYISLMMTIAGLAVALPFAISYINSVFMYLGLAVIVAGFIIRIAFCRCPHCRRGFNTPNFILPKYCPHCGEDLE